MKSLLLLLLLLLLATTPHGPRSAEGAQAQAPQPDPTGHTVDEDLEEFVPSEEISADKAISFPVDI
jgi:hypothetical protein